MGIEWKDEYNFGIEEIDNQHKKLVAIMDKLYTAIQQLKPKEVLNDIFKELFDYAKYHFATEEKYFDKFKYEFSEEHKKEHRYFKKRILELSKDIKKDDLKLASELLDFLEDWLVEHLLIQDKKYVKCFKEHGLK